MRKIKALMPSLREKKRYVAFEVNSQDRLNSFEVGRAIMNSAINFMGELGLAGAGMMHLPEVYKNNKGIVRVNHQYLDNARASFALIKSINNKPATIKSLSASGAINKVKKLIAG